jgi:hypothetical protein
MQLEIYSEEIIANYPAGSQVCDKIAYSSINQWCRVWFVWNKQKEHWSLHQIEELAQAKHNTLM